MNNSIVGAGLVPARVTMKRDDQEDQYTRRNSLRLRGFDYAARRVYFVTVVADQRRKMFCDARVAKATIECLLSLRLKIGFNLYCYCLMPDHLHALVGAGRSQKSLGELVGMFKSLSTRAHWQWYEGKLWQRQFFDHIIRSDEDYYETLKYIRLNPVRKGLVGMAEDWAYTGGIDVMP